ncbi:hypothetical protein PG999_008627 [Apiospora kogelbergensis]|uniref:Uncharacterized protein n=1 Tax=Apiospora kogelbergensis TaxID=1337665 RepID=A0AAW0QL10_9PEZI
MQFTTTAIALLSLAATGLAAPATSSPNDIAAIVARAPETAAVGALTGDATETGEDVFDFDDDDEDDDEEDAEEDGATDPHSNSTVSAFEKRGFTGGWCGLHIKVTNGDYYKAKITVKDGAGAIVKTTEKKNKKPTDDTKFKFKVKKNLPSWLRVNVNVMDGRNYGRIRYEGQDFKTGWAQTKNANCKVGGIDIPNWMIQSRSTVDMDCGFSC